MNDVNVTFHGNVGEDPKIWHTGTRPFARMNVACTPRLRQDEEWTDGPTQWLQVKAWGPLAENVAASIRKGDSVIVTGVYRMEEYTNGEGTTYKTAVVIASAIGFDLRRTRAQAVKLRTDAEPTSQTHGSQTQETGGAGEPSGGAAFDSSDSAFAGAADTDAGTGEADSEDLHAVPF